ncbi:MAG: acyl-CoA thioesterase-2 [Candidatus Endobugula sp.]|jgi:acyl-CoA thioesterase-2
MTTLLNELMNLLSLEQIEENIFRGKSHNVGTGVVFGGQVLGQAISAAQATVDPERKIHSAHAYFLRAGDYNAPIVYMVDVSRDGSTYSARTISAIQHGKPIFTMMCSFQCSEKSDLHYSTEITLPSFDKKFYEEVNLEHESLEQRSVRSKILNNQPFCLRFPKEDNESTETMESYWIKTNQALNEDPLLHRSLLAYASDFRLLTSALRPVHYRYRLKEVKLATLCHSIWFHREFRMDKWLFTQCDPLSVSNGRGLSKGSIYNINGELIATTMQEGVIRKI